jgi:EpsI family protein
MKKLKNIKLFIPTIFLLVTVVLAFIVPKPQYTSLNILNEIKIPESFADWRSIDVSDKLNLNDQRYNFISEIFARLYQNRRGDQILFLILDAGNFHNPKVCFDAAGFLVREKDSAEFITQNNSFKANALHMDSEKSVITMYYWLCLDKKVVGWAGQKVIELWASLINKKKAGLMVRLEVPARGKTEKQCFDFAQSFLKDLDDNLTNKQREYLFGK